jgi:flagellar hook-basal body complex protein FliE
MSIETIGGINQILGKYNSKDWAKSADMSIENPSDFKGLDFKGLDESGQASFSDMLAKSVKDVNNLQLEANNAIQKLVTGKKQNLHETMLAVEKADIAFRTMNQVRMKVIDAYKEVMRMQI